VRYERAFRGWTVSWCFIAVLPKKAKRYRPNVQICADITAALPLLSPNCDEKSIGTHLPYF